jgi:hypothetical protein
VICAASLPPPVPGFPPEGSSDVDPRWVSASAVPQDAGRARCPVAAPPASRIPGPYIRRTLPHELHELYFVPAGCDELIRDRAGRSRFKSTRQHTTLIDQVGFYTLSAHTEDTLAAPPPDPQFTTPGKEPVYVSKVSEGSVPEFCPDRRSCGGRYGVCLGLHALHHESRSRVAFASPHDRRLRTAALKCLCGTVSNYHLSACRSAATACRFSNPSY